MNSAALDATFSALADPTRRAILASLTQGPASVKDLARPFDISGPAIARHLKVLETAGLISRSRSAQLRPAKLESRALKEAADWIAKYRIFWEGSFDRLDAYLEQMRRGERSGDAS